MDYPILITQFHIYHVNNAYKIKILYFKLTVGSPVKLPIYQLLHEHP